MARHFRETLMTSRAGFEEGAVRPDMALFLRDLVHELASPLNALSMNVEILRALSRRRTERLVREAIERLHQDHVRLERLLHGLRVYAAALEEPEHEAVGLCDLLQEAEAMVRNDETPPIATVVADQGACLWMDRQAALCAVAAILCNAAEAGASQVVVAVEAAAGKTRVFFDDDGPGIDNANRARVLDAFFTSHKGDTHFGLGLTTARAVARGHGGDLEVRANALGGTCVVFEIRDPRESKPA